MNATQFANVEVEGYFTVVKHKADANGNVIAGTAEQVMDEKHNLILDNGLDLMATSSGTGFLTWCQVGTGSSSPQVSDTSLQSFVAGTQTKQENVNGTQNTTIPYYGWRRTTFRFAAGTLNNVNVSELGVGPTQNGPVMCRALVLDGQGNPTTITVLSDEVLDVTYEFRLYVPTVNNEGEVTLATEGSTHAWICAPIDVDAAQMTAWDYFLGYPFGGPSTSGAYFGVMVAEPNDVLPVTNTGYGGSSVTTYTLAPYVNGTHYRDITINVDLNVGNFPSGLGRVTMSTYAGGYQWCFTPKLPKTATKKLNLTLRTSWARKVI